MHAWLDNQLAFITILSYFWFSALEIPPPSFYFYGRSILCPPQNVYPVLHKEKDNTEQEDISTVLMQKAENSERFWKPCDGCELRRGLLNVELVGEER
jgi:hypothetical protein